jgi:hypothetical protein
LVSQVLKDSEGKSPPARAEIPKFSFIAFISQCFQYRLKEVPTKTNTGLKSHLTENI